MLGFKKKHNGTGEAAKKQSNAAPQQNEAAQPDTDQLPEDMLENACGYTPEHYTAPAGLFRKPTPEDLM